MRRGDLAFSLLNVVLGFDIYFCYVEFGGRSFCFAVEVSRYFFFFFFRHVSSSGKRNGAWSLCMRTNILDEKFV